MLKRTIIPAILFLALSATPAAARACDLTEELLPPPPELAGKKLALMADAFVATGPSKQRHCLAQAETIGRQLLSPGILENATVGKAYFEKDGQVVTPLGKGVTFTVEELLKVKDPSGAAVYYIVAKDDKSRYYIVFPELLGLYNGPNGGDADLPLAVVDKDQPVAAEQVDILGYRSFDGAKYTGLLENPSQATRGAASRLVTLVPQYETALVTTFSAEEIGKSLAATPPASIVVHEQPPGKKVTFDSIASPAGRQPGVADDDMYFVGLFKEANGAPGKLVGYGSIRDKKEVALTESASGENLYAILYRDGLPLRRADNTLTIVKFPVRK